MIFDFTNSVPIVVPMAGPAQTISGTFTTSTPGVLHAVVSRITSGAALPAPTISVDGRDISGASLTGTNADSDSVRSQDVIADTEFALTAGVHTVSLVFGPDGRTDFNEPAGVFGLRITVLAGTPIEGSMA